MKDKLTKYIIYKQGEKIKGSTADNYYSIIQDGNKIQTFDGFKSLQQAKEYIIKYSKLTDEEIKTIEDEEVIKIYK